MKERMNKNNVFSLFIALMILGMGPNAQAEDYQVSFSNTPLSDFALAAAKTLGKNLSFSGSLKGSVTLQSEKLSQDDYLNLLKLVLRNNGYALSERDGTLIVVDSDKVNAAFAQDNTAPNGSSDEIVTRIVPLSHMSSAEASSTVEHLLNGNKDVLITAVNSNGMVIVTGFRDAVDKVLRILHKMDTVDTLKENKISLEYASAQSLATEITDVLRSRGQTDHVDITADPRTNSLIVSASDDDMDKLKALIGEMDVPDEGLEGESGDNKVIYLKYAQAREVAEVVQKVIGSDKASLSHVVADEKVNAVIISAYGDELDQLEQLIHKLDIRRAQVHVEAMIVEVADADGINFGVQWGSTDGSLIQFSNGTQIPLGALAGAAYQAKENKGSTVIDENGNTTVNPDSKGDLSTLLSILSGYNGAALSVVKGNWMALIQAVKTSSSANILSTPSITTLDNQKASFMVGEEVPVITGSTTSANNTNPFQTVDRRNVGTKLTILPQINSGNTVQLQLSAEVSKVEGNTGVDVVFAERKLETTVLAENGSLVILGGLIDEQEDVSHSRIPVLGDIPVIGKLFSSENTSKKKRNLMIFLRPTILQGEGDMDDISKEKYQFIHEQYLSHHSVESNNGKPDSRKVSDEVSAFKQVRLDD